MMQQVMPGEEEGEAIVDICLALAAIRNTSSQWTSPFHL